MPREQSQKKMNNRIKPYRKPKCEIVNGLVRDPENHDAKMPVSFAYISGPEAKEIHDAFFVHHTLPSTEGTMEFEPTTVVAFEPRRNDPSRYAPEDKICIRVKCKRAVEETGETYVLCMSYGSAREIAWAYKGGLLSEEVGVESAPFEICV